MGALVDKEIWLSGVEQIPSPNFDERSCDADHIEQYVDLLVIHNISLPPALCEADFSARHVEAFFCNQLDLSCHPIFSELQDVKVSSHLYIRRDGSVVQFVPLNKRAWHAGKSEFKGRSACNDFSIGIELQGTDNLPYLDAQYDALVKVTKQIQKIFNNITLETITGHCHIAPERKTDPGPSFDWSRFRTGLLSTS